MTSPTLRCKILSSYRSVLKTIKQIEKEINLTVKGGGEHHLLGTVNVCCYISRAMTGIASH